MLDIRMCSGAGLEPRSMRPVLFQLGSLPVYGYAVLLLVAFGVACFVRRAEVQRLGYDSTPAHRSVGLGALLGAVVGAKLGMVLFVPFEGFVEMLQGMLSLDFSGKTVVGGLIGGYLGVEITKRIVGVNFSTGDGFAVSLPLAQAIGRLGCLLHGCCYGTEFEGRWALSLNGVMRHPTPLYEAGLDLVLAAFLFSIRHRPRTQGHLFKSYLLGYALIRFVLEPFRGDPSVMWGGMTAVQWVCLAGMAGFGWQLRASDVQSSA